MADKYLELNSQGILAEKAGQVASAGAADGGKLVALDPTGRLDMSVLPTGVGADVAVVQASEDLSPGDFVNIHDDSGPRVRRAAGTSITLRAHGFVKQGVTAGNTVEVYFEGENPDLTGQTPGSILFLSATTPGAVTDTPPTAAGQIVQGLGIALTATSMDVEIAQPAIRA